MALFWPSTTWYSNRKKTLVMHKINRFQGRDHYVTNRKAIETFIFNFPLYKILKPFRTSALMNMTQGINQFCRFAKICQWQWRQSLPYLLASNTSLFWLVTKLNKLNGFACYMFKCTKSILLWVWPNKKNKKIYTAIKQNKLVSLLYSD